MSNKPAYPDAMYSKLDMLPLVDMSYSDWDVSEKRRERFELQRRNFGIADFDAYNLSNSVAGLLSNALLIAHKNTILPDESIWSKSNTHLVKRQGIEDSAYDAISLLTAFKTDSESSIHFHGKEVIQQAFLTAFTILPVLKSPLVNPSEYDANLQKSYIEDRVIHMVSHLDTEGLGYKVIHMIASGLINLAQNYIAFPPEYGAEKWEEILMQAAKDFVRREFMPDNSIPESAQKFFVDHVETLWD